MFGFSVLCCCCCCYFVKSLMWHVKIVQQIRLNIQYEDVCMRTNKRVKKSIIPFLMLTDILM